MKARLYLKYKKDIIKKIQEILKTKNEFIVPKIIKICINASLSTKIYNFKQLKKIYDNLISITGQKPKITKAKKSISSFKLRKGMAIGCKVTLRNKIMYEFLDRMINIGLPRIKDFTGIKKSQFDKNGNLSIGIREKSIFPEIKNINEYKGGINITLVTNKRKHEISQILLKSFNIPFIE